MTEYLTEIKFRNAVKKATKLRVFNKNEFNYCYGVTIAKALIVGVADNETIFTVDWHGGSKWSPSGAVADYKLGLCLANDLLAAGFEPVAVSLRSTLGPVKSVIAFRKAVK